MKIIADVHGWRKELDVDPIIYNRRYIELFIFYPLAISVDEIRKLDINAPAGISILLRDSGKRTESGKPVFKYEP